MWTSQPWTRKEKNPAKVLAQNQEMQILQMIKIDFLTIEEDRDESNVGSWEEKTE